MKIPQEPNNQLEIINKISAGIAAGNVNVIKQARFYNTPIISWQDGKIIQIDPFTIHIPEDN